MGIDLGASPRLADGALRPRARDIALGAGALSAAARNDAGASRDWTAAGVFCDLADLLTTLATWRRLPRTRAIVAVAAGGAAVIGGLAVATVRIGPQESAAS